MVVNEGGSDIYRRGLNKGAKKKKRKKKTAQAKWQRTVPIPAPVASEQLGLLSI